MKKNNRQLYEKIMRNISKEIKYILNEDIQNFDVNGYQDDELDPISNQEITNIVDPEAGLLNDVLFNNYNPADFNYNEKRLWNEKIAGTVIDENGTIAIKIKPQTSYFVAQLIHVNNIKYLEYGYVSVRNNIIKLDPDDEYEDEAPIMKINDITKDLIIQISKSIKNKGKLPIMGMDEIFAVIDTDCKGDGIITFSSIGAAIELGFNKDEIKSNNNIMINSYMRNLLNECDYDLDSLSKYHDIHYIWVMNCKYNKNNI